MSSAELTIPYTFEASILRARRRKADRVFVRATTKATVREIEAQTVARVAVDRPERRPLEAPIRIDLKYAEGRFWRPMQVRPEPKAEPAPLTAEAHGAIGRMAALAPAWSDLHHMGSMQALAGLDSPDIKEIVWDTSAERRRYVSQQAARSARLIGGVLHRATSEPVYAMGQGGGIYSGFLAEVRARTPAARIWRGDDQDALLDYVVSAPSDRQDKLLEAFQIDVLRPDVLTWNRDLEVRADAVDLLLKAVHEDLMAAPAKLVRSWLQLRDMAAGAKRYDQAAQDAARELLLGCRSLGVAKQKHLDAVELALSEVERALERSIQP